MSNLIKEKSSDIQKLPRYISEIVTSTFKAGTGGCAHWSGPPGFLGCDVCVVVFPTILSYT